MLLSFTRHSIVSTACQCLVLRVASSTTSLTDIAEPDCVGEDRHISCILASASAPARLVHPPSYSSHYKWIGSLSLRAHQLRTHDTHQPLSPDLEVGAGSAGGATTANPLEGTAGEETGAKETTPASSPAAKPRSPPQVKFSVPAASGSPKPKPKTGSSLRTRRSLEGIRPGPILSEACMNQVAVSSPGE